MIFNDNHIVLSFAAISDIHLTGAGDADDSEKKFRTALTDLQKTAKQNGHPLDLVLIAGDLIDRSWERPLPQVAAFSEIYSSACGTPLFYCLGDAHDLYWGGKNEKEMIGCFQKTLGNRNFIYDKDMKAAGLGNRHAVCNGYHFIALQPCQRGPILYSDETKQWLASLLDEISSQNGLSYVFIITHPMISNTCYGSTLGDIWDTGDLTKILSEHPNIVIFSGHLHFPLNDERSIMQTDFTSVGCGAVRYMAIENGGYENMAGKTTMKDSSCFSQGLLCELDGNGTLRITRMDFYHNRKIKEPWILFPPQKDRSHLEKYSPARANKSPFPFFPETFFIKAEFYDTQSGKRMKLRFAKGYDEDFVHHYHIDIRTATGFLRSYQVLSDFYRHPSPENMAEEVVLFPEDTFPSGDLLHITIHAVNSWGKKSREKVFSCIACTACSTG